MSGDAKVFNIGNLDTEQQKKTVEQPEKKVEHVKNYHCRMCRMFLFSEQDLVTHEPREDRQHAFRNKHGANGKNKCTSFFLDPDTTPWVSEDSRTAIASSGGGAKDAVVGDLDTLHCPNEKCRTKLGGVSWTGSQCSCGGWVTPSFRVSISRTDQFIVEAEA